MDGDTIIGEKTYDLVQNKYTSETEYFYDSAGSVVGYLENGYYYYYDKNLQGDIIAHFDQQDRGDMSYPDCASEVYEYDEWGNITKITYGSGDSGFYYRGYYYDHETGLYYLNSRYYDPEIGRFLNADGLIDNRGLHTQNLYAYCANNPVLRIDIGGDFWLTALIVTAVATVVLGVNHINNELNEDEINSEIKSTYTEQTAKEEIKPILDKYNKNIVDEDKQVSVEFNDNDVEIKQSFLVSSRYDRQKISMILSRTEGFEREYDDISAEWNLHNKGYYLHINVDSNRDANLDFSGDSRWYVRALYNTLEFLGSD